jgi:hypothetical protein
MLISSVQTECRQTYCTGIIGLGFVNHTVVFIAVHVNISYIGSRVIFLDPPFHSIIMYAITPRFLRHAKHHR